MALRRINPRKKPLLLVPRPFSSSSSSSSSNPPFPPPPPPSDDPAASSHSRSSPAPNLREAHNPASSLFQDIRDRLRSSPTPPPPRRIPSTPHRPSTHSQGPTLSFDEIRRSLESFHTSRNTGGASRSSAAAGATPSFQELLRNNPAPAPPQAHSGGGTKHVRFKGLLESLRKIDPAQQQRPHHSPMPFLSSIPESIFGKELRDRTGKPQGQRKEEGDSGIVLTNRYSYEELGKMLGEQRPAAAGKDGKEWFSLEELQGRIAKLAELEKKREGQRYGLNSSDFRESLANIKKDEDTKKFKSMQNIALLANLGGEPMPEYMLQRKPPQEELLERYFHPDHMSSEEKMKLELQRVRDEFKMSENDCGSARVQIAQLTVKIKHLSAVLHKKDKHSRKGLQDMVQQRKKYLKYLRRTDWDSYCLVLSKLGLRDVPEYKAPDYKSQSTTKAKSKKSKSKKKRKMKA